MRFRAVVNSTIPSFEPDWPLLYFEFWAYGARNPALREEFSKRRLAIQAVIAQALERQCAELGLQIPIAAEQAGSITAA